MPHSELPEPSATLSPAAPRLLADFQTLETFWRVHIPKGYEVTDTAGNLGEVLGQVRHGKKVKGLMDQISRIKTAGESAGQRGKKRAQYNISQLEQALSDALEDIEKESSDTRNAAEQVDRRARHEQLAETRQWSRQGNDKLSQLKNERELRREDAIEELDPVDQDFEDARVFMEEQLSAQYAWRSSRADVDSGYRDIRELRGQLAVSDVPERTLSALEYQRSKPRRPSVDLEGLQFADVSPLDIEVPRGGRIFTYRRTAGDPRLQIEVTSTTVHSSGLHWLGLVLSLVALAVCLRRPYSTG